jgi:hypothetical protein
VALHALIKSWDPISRVRDTLAQRVLGAACWICHPANAPGRPRKASLDLGLSTVLCCSMDSQLIGWLWSALNRPTEWRRKTLVLIKMPTPWLCGLCPRSRVTCCHSEAIYKGVEAFEEDVTMTLVSYCDHLGFSLHTFPDITTLQRVF